MANEIATPCPACGCRVDLCANEIMQLRGQPALLAVDPDTWPIPVPSDLLRWMIRIVEREPASSDDEMWGRFYRLVAGGTGAP